MPEGPHEARLDTYVAGGNVANIRHTAQVWDKGQKVLEDLAMALESAEPHLINRFGPQTGPAAVAAFAQVAHNVRAQAAEMQKAVSALKSAGDALEDAQTTHRHLGNAPASPPGDPSQKAGESAEAFHLRQRDAHAAQSHYASVFADRETRAQQATKGVDTHYEHAIAVMETIHGRPRATTDGGGAGGGGAVPGGGLPPGPGGAASGGRHPLATLHGGHTGGTHTGGMDTGGTDTGGTDTSGTDAGSTTTGGGTDAPPTYGDPGQSQGPGYPGGPTPGGTTPGGPTPGGPGGPGGTTPPGGLPGTATGPAGPSGTSTAVGGVLSGGLLGGSSSLSSALRSTALRQSTLSAEEQALLASRTTGTGGAAGPAGAGTAGRGGAAGMTGRSGGGAGAGGRGDRGRRKKRSPGVDFFEDNDDWVDDDEAAPGVLD